MAGQVNHVAKTVAPRQSAQRVALFLSASLLGLTLVAAAGWYLWNRYTLPSLSTVRFDSLGPLLVFGFLAGIGAFFAPCAFALFPGYVSYYLAASGKRGGIVRSLGLGLACAAGSVTFFSLVGIAITLAGGAISPYLIGTKPFIALAVVALGIAQLSDVRMPSLALSLGFGAGRRFPVTAAMFLYGFGYALASTGCTLPLYVSITVLPLVSGFSGTAFLTFLAFAAAMAVLMLVTTLLVGLAKQNLLRALQDSVVWIKRASGVVLILAGLYLVYYYVRAGM